MDRRLGRPLPCQLSNPTRAHLSTVALWYPSHAKEIHHAVLAQVSLCYPSLTGRLLTRYSPVRHCNLGPRTQITVRLECVMHAASVHPEPGSNSLNYCMSTDFHQLISTHQSDLCSKLLLRATLYYSKEFSESIKLVHLCCCSIFNERLLCSGRFC